MLNIKRERKSQIVSFRITASDWFKYRKACREVGISLGELASRCFEVHADEELQAFEEWKVAEAQKTIEEYEKRHK